MKIHCCCLFLSACLAAAGSPASRSAQVESTGAILLQTSLEVGHIQAQDEQPVESIPVLGETVAIDARARDARFLIRASFGPTRATLSSIQGITHADWIAEQVALPIELHRSYYRQHSNPHFEAALSEQIGLMRSPCAAESRWRNFAFIARDVGKSFELRSGKLLVDGRFRTDVQSPPLASQWWGLGNTSGFLCAVEEEVGGDVQVDSDEECRQKTLLPNPRAWSTSSEHIASLTQVQKVRPGVYIGDLSASSICAEAAAEAPHMARHQEHIVIFEERLELLLNTPEKPIRTARACVPRNEINEDTCRLPTFAPSSRKQQGLSVKVWRRFDGQGDFLDPAEAAGTLTEFAVPDLNFSSMVNARFNDDFPLQWHYAAHFSGTLRVEQGGTYDFFLSSDDGSRLMIDGKAVVNNGGYHGFRERTGSSILSSGEHSIHIDYFQGGSGQALILEWSGPDSGSQRQVVPAQKLSTMVRPFEGECYIACGSPGEGSNEPGEGHQFAIYSSSNRRRTPAIDQSLDNRYTRRMGAELTKSTVWVAKALGGQDQMRQRMAWGLSQIFVVSVQGLGLGHLTEPWLALYDIFVRAAMGNFWSILQEVTYNPLMGKYLTHTGSSSYAYNQNYPNENYAREVMQLFSIGLDLLQPDGTPVRGPDGHIVPSYSNEQILNFARVFTGFAENADRDNIESERSNMNLIDPMIVRVERHDIYPKPDLNGNYLGDIFPSCLDVLPAQAFLDKGARYEFRGFGADTEDAFELMPDSSLFKFLCAADKEAQCSFSPVVELKEKLDCTGVECEQDACVREVVVAGARFVFRPPVCVHRFFHDFVAKLDSNVEGSRDSDLSSKEGQSTGEISTKTKSSATTFTLKPVGSLAEGWKPGYCVNADSARVWSFRLRLDELDGSDELRKEQCVAKCRQAGGSGCEMIFDRNGHGCYVHMSPLAAGSGLQPTGHLCWVFDINQSALLGHSYQLMPKSMTQCPDGTQIETVSECREAAKSLGLKPESEWAGNASWARLGCSLSGGKQVIWNFGGQPNAWTEQLCRAHIVVDQQGVLGLPDGGSSLAVRWIGGTAPAAGTHVVNVTTGRLFDSTPSLQALQSQAHIGSYTPSGACFACDGEVRAYGEPGTFDEHTVFEANGQFYKNIQSIVSVIGGGQRFRNPPVFLKSNGDQDAERSVHAEIRTMLEHLFHHGNTPVFVSKRLIQRFTTSNPSPQYLSDVSTAFRAGEYNQLSFSGAYGDLAATAAAILLHPEADELTDSEQDTSFRGALREPVLKFMHFMRAMEYEDVDGQPVVFRRLQDVIGQFPYESPTVFNFYSADYELPMNTVAEPEPEAEQEEEEEEEADKRQPAVSPEFQIFTPSFFVGYLNGMSLLTRTGVSEDCAGGDGTGLGIRAVEVSADRYRDVCPQGRLLLPGHASVEETIAELDVLLTGGRLTPGSKEMVRAAAEEASQKDMLQAAQLAVVMTAEFNTLGKPLPLEGARPELVQEERPASRPYRAAVMLFFGGGADTFNLLVPMDCPLYNEYLEVRTDLALQASELGKISTTGQPCSSFGIHGRFPFLRSLYTAGEGAFVSNVGNLVRPTTLHEHQANQGERCFGLFSHSDQQNAAQTMKCQDFGTAARGAGGRIADALSSGSQKFSTTSFSLAGSAIWSRGFDTQREIVDERDTVGFSQYEAWRQGIHNITAQRHGNAYAEAYATAFLQAIETTENLGRVIDGAQLKTAYSADSQLGRQLRQVAKLIQTHDGRAVERDFFFVSVGGWDHHSNMKEALASRFQEVDDALKSFVAELRQQGNWDKVVLFTSSEFGRTLDSNGGGSDHAWAGNHFVIGGGIKGGRVLNSFPSSLAEGSPRDLGRGRLIPEFPWESMLVPIASWMGVEEAAMDEVFPNLGNFNASHLIPTSELFEA